ncbi:uncharacterized protein A1O9_04842 [Exophiala aquamarina CBS 119918]|uniref:DUF1996 domain-containing protein n=1 Tax=Exophiala aquamarina CBS 119918 TaxID=1182545 RepID=A0A072PIP4_9EURO|nr:uncharacterized protein A1O9_04842 [Exophiala aquamarina CBS 119918]KEF59994.1 hypothetical protein A1O9_04842 [Exophiala aquamarina CBS 119918]
MKPLHLPLSSWLLALQPTVTFAYWRMACAVSQTSRADPIVDPGTVSGHVHKFAGGNNVNQNSDFNSLLSSTCSSCEIQSDKSAYWTPQLYFAHANGKFEEVPNFGMTVYYVAGRGGTSSNTQPFPPGFKMISGDSTARSYDSTTMTYLNTRPVADRVSFRCIDEANDIPEQHYMFRTDCVNGMRAQINFQSCWDGENLYLENSAHVAYLSGIDYGSCPPSHPIPIPGLFFEVLYFTNQVDQSGGGEFVFSNGDATGYSFHADFINGWDMDIQDAAVKNCLYTDDGGVISACEYLAPNQDVNFARTCPQQPSVFDEQSLGVIDALPGCNPITHGPESVVQETCPVGQHALEGPSASSQSSTTLQPTTLGSSSAASSTPGSVQPAVDSSLAVSSSSASSVSTFASFNLSSTKSSTIAGASGLSPSSQIPPSSTQDPSTSTTSMDTTTSPSSTPSSGVIVNSTASAAPTLTSLEDPTAPITDGPTGSVTSVLYPDTSITTATLSSQSFGDLSSSVSPSGQVTFTTLETTSPINGAQEESISTTTVTSYTTITVTIPFNRAGNFIAVTTTASSAVQSAIPGAQSTTTILMTSTSGDYSSTGVPPNTIRTEGSTESLAPTGTAVSTPIAVDETVTIQTTATLVSSGEIFTITGPTTTTFLSDAATSMGDDVESTTTMWTTVTMFVTVTPTSTRTIHYGTMSSTGAVAPATTSQDTTFATSVVSPGAGSSVLVSSTISIDNALGCSLYSEYSLVGCAYSPDSPTGAAATAFVTVTAPIAEETTSTAQTTLMLSISSINTTVFTLRGRKVTLIG